MTTTAAATRICPFLSSNEIANPGSASATDMHMNIPTEHPLTHFVYCMTTGCMAWVYTNEKKNEGYCLRLMT